MKCVSEIYPCVIAMIANVTPHAILKSTVKVYPVAESIWITRLKPHYIADDDISDLRVGEAVADNVLDNGNGMNLKESGCQG